MKIGTFDVAAREQDPEQQADPDYIELCGEKFEIQSDMSSLPFMKFASAAEVGGDSAEMVGLAALLGFLREAIEPKDWFRFEQVVSANKVKDDTLMDIAAAVVAAKTGNVSRPSSGSSAGRPSTSPKSKSGRGKSAAKSTSGPAGSKDVSELSPEELRELGVAG